MTAVMKMVLIVGRDNGCDEISSEKESCLEVRKKYLISDILSLCRVGNSSAAKILLSNVIMGSHAMPRSSGRMRRSCLLGLRFESSKFLSFLNGKCCAK